MMIDIDEKIDELKEKYKLPHGIVYDTVTNTEDNLRIIRTGDFFFNEPKYYRELFFIVNRKLSLLKKESELEKILKDNKKI